MRKNFYLFIKEVKKDNYYWPSISWVFLDIMAYDRSIIIILKLDSSIIWLVLGSRIVLSHESNDVGPYQLIMWFGVLFILL